jgi:hypothetical protein
MTIRLENPADEIRKVLNDRDRRGLDEYLVQLRPYIELNNPNTSDIALMCIKALKVQVSCSQITNRVGPKGKLYVHIWPGTATALKGRAADRLLSNQLLELMAGLYHHVELMTQRMQLAGLTVPTLTGSAAMKNIVAQFQNVEVDDAEDAD